MRPFISGLKIPLSVSKAQIGMASLSSMPCGECWCCWWFLGNEAEQTECSPVRFINWRKNQAMSSINWDNFWSNFRISIWPPWKGSHLSWLRTNITNTRGRVEFHRSSVIRVFPNHDLAVEKVPGHGLQYDHILFSKPLSIFFIKMAQINHASSCFLCHTLPGLGDERNRFLLFRLIALTKRFVQTIHLAQPQIRTCHTILTRLRSFSCKLNNTNNTNNCISVPQSAFQSVDNPMRRTSFVTGISIESSSVILIIGSLPGSEAEFRFKSAVLWNMAIAWYTLNDLIHPDSLWHAEFQVFSTCPNFGAVWAMPSFVKWNPFIVQARLTGLSLSKHRNIQLRCWHVLASMLSIRLHKIIMVLLPCFCLFPTVFAVYNSSAKQIHWSHPNLPLNFQSHMKLSPHTSPKSPQLHRL